MTLNNKPSNLLRVYPFEPLKNLFQLNDGLNHYWVLTNLQKVINQSLVSLKLSNQYFFSINTRQRVKPLIKKIYFELFIGLL